MLALWMMMSKEGGWNSLPVVKEVVGQIIADVSEDAAAEH